MSFGKISLWDLCKSFQSNSKHLSWQDLCKRPLGKFPATDLYGLCRRSLKDVSWQDLCKLSVRGLLARSLYEISVDALLGRSMQETSWQDSCNRDLCNVSAQDLQKRCLGSTSLQDLSLSLSKKSFGEKLRNRNFTPVFFKVLDLHFVRKGCSSSCKIAILPQFSKFDFHFVRKLLHLKLQNCNFTPVFEGRRPFRAKKLHLKLEISHRATARAIRCAQSDERVARAHVWFSQNIARTTKNEHWKCQKRRFTQVSATFLSRSTKSCACHKRWARGLWKYYIQNPQMNILTEEYGGGDD